MNMKIMKKYNSVLKQTLILHTFYINNLQIFTCLPNYFATFSISEVNPVTNMTKLRMYFLVGETRENLYILDTEKRSHNTLSSQFQDIKVKNFFAFTTAQKMFHYNVVKH